jgi:DNA-binding FrmR family transcriptional regulator
MSERRSAGRMGEKQRQARGRPPETEDPMELPETAIDELTRRLARVEGQVRGITAMLRSGRECRDIVTQIAAARRALESVGFKLLASGLAQCLDDPDRARAAGDSVEEFERLFLKIA